MLFDCKYDCEIEGCVEKTDGFLCENHAEEAQDEDMKLIVCANCLKMLRIEKRNKVKQKYEFVEDCMRCRRIQIDDNFFPNE